MDDDDIDIEVEQWGRRLDQLDAAVDAAEAVGDPRPIAAAYTELVEHLAGVIDPEELIGPLICAREAFEQFDPVEAALRAVDVAHCAVAAGDLDQAASALDIAMEEFDELGEEERLIRAMAMFGSAVAQLGEFDLAEQALSTVLGASGDLGFDVDEIVEVRVTLANIYSATGRTAAAETELTSLVADVPVGTYSEAICRESLGGLYGESNRPALAKPEMERAITIYETLGEEMRVLEARMGLSWVLLAVGQGDSGSQMLADVRARFAEMGRDDRTATCDYTLAQFHMMRYRFADADAAFASAATGLAKAGMHHQLANLQWNRVKRLSMEAAVNPARREELKHEAIDTAISAVIAAEYERFQFGDAARRAQWMEKLGHRMTMTFLLVYAGGSPQLMADLIEVALSGGVYGLDTGGAEEIAPIDGGADTAAAAGDDAGVPALVLGAAALLATPVLPLAPPPALMDGNGRELLAAQRELAATLDPDLRGTLGAAPRVRAW